MSVPVGATIAVECIGYKAQTIAVGDKTVFDIVLEEDNEMLEETVVVGYGVQRKSDLTGSVASVRSTELANRSAVDAAAALQGKAAGVQIFNDSGAPGSGSSIRVRGISSNSSAGLGPLLIVDGLKVDDIQYLDPSMIESMEVLKDAASAAIYGAQAGNGVVLITTKSGSKGKDGTIFYNYKLTVDQLGRYAQVMNAQQYMDWQHQAGLLGTPEELIANGTWDGVTDTRWADVLYGTGFTHNHTVGAQGADAIMANEPNSARRKAYIATYEEMLVDYEYSSLDYKADGTPLTKEEKLMDPKRGMNFYKYDELYANYGYFFLKFMPWEEDLIPNDPSITDENRTIMRYSEVLLLYAEACAMSTDDGSGLAALNKVAQRAGAPTYAELNMENVKKEKWFELAWEGTRFLDLVRWGDAEKELAFKAKDEVPYLFDEFYVHGTKGKEVSGKPHEARIIFKDDGWDELGGGYVAGKHELYPFPFDVIELNRWDEATGTGLKQNPGWE